MNYPTLFEGKQSPLTAFGWWWRPLKDGFEQSLPIVPQAVHVLVGVCIQLLAARWMRRSIAELRPWFVVLFLIVANESADLLSRQWPWTHDHVMDSVRDLVLTMFLPTLLLVAARTRPGMFRS